MANLCQRSPPPRPEDVKLCVRMLASFVPHGDTQTSAAALWGLSYLAEHVETVDAVVRADGLRAVVLAARRHEEELLRVPAQRIITLAFDPRDTDEKAKCADTPT